MFETQRLTVARIEDEHLDDLYHVYLSNSDYLRITEGTPDGVGVYTRDQMLRDLQVAEWTGRTSLGVFRREDRKLIGVLEYWERSDTDGMPWLGLLMIHRDCQRRGFGRESAEGFLQWVVARGWPEVRLGVVEENVDALPFWRALGFREYERKEKRFPSGVKQVICLRYEPAP
ncbi:GNAT family N-acetyltransferase [Polycladomyces subterraneus]|uniref:GNAT family N-acetyltransferase n=1 Tax=Polycladomyces subterraneus TaxID=1016997 RepID=A0ABT8IJC0_9BACL|nr:GNAT family N-acetyltransferase [Polycladomyces subterraneus]MDN4592834.1 GNAT family N-acetyltransferase [Polycladomyces subterraneus]